MTRVSDPSVGAASHWSCPFPCRIRSATSTMTTVRARFFSARRCAVVAPTFPAPTTVILFTIALCRLKEGRMGVREKSYPSRRMPATPSAAYLRERTQPADAHLQQRVLLRLLCQRAAEERCKWLASAQCITKVHLVITEEACTKPSIRRQPNPIA